MVNDMGHVYTSFNPVKTNQTRQRSGRQKTSKNYFQHNYNRLTNLAHLCGRLKLIASASPTTAVGQILFVCGTGLVLKSQVIVYRILPPGAIQSDGWKLLVHPYGPADSQREAAFELYNVRDDPSETFERSQDQPDIFNKMVEQFNDVFEDIVPFDFPDDLDVDITDGEGNIVTGWC